MSQPVCFVVAQGRGLRMHARTHGACKGLLPLQDTTSILSNLVAACRTVGLNPVIVARPDEPKLAELASLGETRHLSPQGYVYDLATLTAGVDDVVIIDCDIVASPESLASALRVLLASEAEFALALSALPLSNDPRSIRPIVAEGRFTGLADKLTAPRTAGIYRFRGGVLRSLHDFTATATGTFHDLMDALADRNVPAETHVLDVAFNVNWPEDYAAAVSWWKDRSHPSPFSAKELTRVFDHRSHGDPGQS